jgi:transposase InsO family protein
VHGELLTLGITLAPSTVWEILREARIDPAPDRAATTWTDFLRSQADALLAADFIKTVTLTGARRYILTVIEHASRRIRILGVTAHPTAAWVGQAARNLAMDLEDAGCKAKYLIRDRDGKYPGLFDAILEDAGINVVPSGIQVPRMNAIIERWVRTCRRELLDRTLTGTSTICCTRCGNTNGSTTHTARIRGSPTSDRSSRCPNRSPTRTDSPG